MFEAVLAEISLLANVNSTRTGNIRLYTFSHCPVLAV